MCSWIKSFRVSDPDDQRITMLGFAGWQLIDVTYDPHQQNWVVTMQLPFGDLGGGQSRGEVSPW